MIPVLPWWAWNIIASISITAVEYFNRSISGTWLTTLRYSFVFILLAQFSLYKGFSGAPSWYLAWLTFTLINHVSRGVAISLTAGHEVASWSYIIVAVVVIMGGSILLKLGLNS